MKMQKPGDPQKWNRENARLVPPSKFITSYTSKICTPTVFYTVQILFISAVYKTPLTLKGKYL